MKKQGSITVFLSLSLLCVFALICVMVEQARLAGSRCYFQMAVNASLDTLFSQYHRTLWDTYRVLGLQYESEPDIIHRLEYYIGQYLDTENWYPMELEYAGIDLCENLTDQGGDFFIQEILAYMNYGVWNSLELQPEKGEQLLKDVEEGFSAGMMSGSYDDQEKEVRRLEKVVGKLLDCVEAQERYAEHIRMALASDSPETFYDAASLFRKEAGKMDALILSYVKRAEQLQQSVENGTQLLSETEECFQQERSKQFGQQMNPYRDYVEVDGKRYQEILSQQQKSRRNNSLLQDTWELVEQLEEEYEERLREAEDSEEEISVDDLSLAQAASKWTGYSSTHLRTERQDGDEEKRGFLEQVRDLAQGNLLEMVLPEEMSISRGSIPSGIWDEAMVNGDSLKNRNPVERALVNEYCRQFFLNALSEEIRQVQYELEYILQGERTDKKNLEKTIEQLFLVRQGLNFIHILSDHTKREEIHSLAAVITGATGLAPLLEISACFIMVVWAMGEAVADLQILMSGGRVPLWKKAENWSLSLDGLLSMGQEYKESHLMSLSTGDSKVVHIGENKEIAKGMDYADYLKLLLLAGDQKLQQERMLRLVQMNLQREEPGFLLSKCAYQVDIRGRACGKFVFFSLPHVENFIYGEKHYILEAKAQKQY